MMASFAGSVFAAFSPHRRTIATASTSFERAILLQDVESGEILRLLNSVGHQGNFIPASFVGSEASKLVSVSTDDTCQPVPYLPGTLL